MKELEALLSASLGDGIPVRVLIRLAPILAPIVKDLSDGDAHLSQDNRAALQEAIDNILAEVTE